MSPHPRTDAVANAIGASGIDWHHSATLMRRHGNILESETVALRKELAEVTAAFQKECDHDFEKVDDSFSHEFGCEIIRYMRCEKCGKHAEWDDVDHPEADDEPRIDQRELRDFP